MAGEKLVDVSSFSLGELRRTRDRLTCKMIANPNVMSPLENHSSHSQSRSSAPESLRLALCMQGAHAAHSAEAETPLPTDRGRLLPMGKSMKPAT